MVLDSGLGGPAMEWAAVQPGVAKITRVCSYDRAGYGWSDSAPPDTLRPSRQIVDELHTLLTKAGVEGPYVLVGHSFGGFNVRLYASRYPEGVAGLVLVAAGHEDMFARMPPEFTRTTESNQQVDKIMQPLTILGLTRLAGQTGLLASFTGLLEELPSETQAEFVALSLYRARSWDTRAKESAGLEASMSQVRAAGSLGDLPLVVLSGEPDLGRVPPDFPVDKVRETARALQVELAQLSTNSTHIVCDTCGHYIPLTNPELVVQAIHQVIEG